MCVCVCVCAYTFVRICQCVKFEQKYEATFFFKLEKEYTIEEIFL